jgi:tetratricopeptide (TPR) repeat protein
LSEPEQLLLDRLSVFAGGCTLAAATAVCAGEGVEDWEVLDRLVNKSLVQTEEADGEVRYGLLETVRQYGQERLVASGGVEAARDRHLAWYLALAEEARPHLEAPEQGVWLDRLEREHDNLRAALGWSIRAAGDASLGQRLAGALWRFWYMRGYSSEGQGWLEAALAMGDQDSPAARATALNGAGLMAFDQGDLTQAAARYEESLGLRRELGDTGGIASSLNNLGKVAGDLGRAAALYEEALALYREQGDHRGSAEALSNLGLVAVRQGDPARAAALHEEALRLHRELGNTEGIAYALGDLGRVAASQRDLGRATALHEEALGMWRALGHRAGSGFSLNMLGSVAYQQGEYERATRLHEEALTMFRDLGYKNFIAHSLNYLGSVAHAQGDLGRAATLLEESLLVSREVAGRWLQSLSLESLAWVAIAHAQPQRAARLGGAAEALREASGAILVPEQWAGHDQAVEAMRTALGEDGFAVAWAAGLTLSLDEAVALALEGHAQG